MEIAFRSLTKEDLPILHEWLCRRHVVEWWEPTPTMAQVEADYADALAGDVNFRCYIAIADERPVGFAQSYTPSAFHDQGWWTEEHDPSVRGIDQFLANEDDLSRGIGTAMVTALVAQLFIDPTVTRVQADPHPGNPRAIRCYEKAGFRAVREIETPDGRALLMYCDRPALLEHHVPHLP